MTSDNITKECQRCINVSELPLLFRFGFSFTGRCSQPTISQIQWQKETNRLLLTEFFISHNKSGSQKNSRKYENPFDSNNVCLISFQHENFTINKCCILILILFSFVSFCILPPCCMAFASWHRHRVSSTDLYFQLYLLIHIHIHIHYYFYYCGTAHAIITNHSRLVLLLFLWKNPELCHFTRNIAKKIYKCGKCTI